MVFTRMDQMICTYLLNIINLCVHSKLDIASIQIWHR